MFCLDLVRRCSIYRCIVGFYSIPGDINHSHVHCPGRFVLLEACCKAGQGARQGRPIRVVLTKLLLEDA